jgi:ribosomal protein L12E/L44/L45/RPP1/RPP2
MEEVYACLLLHELKQPITVENLAKVLQSAGASVDEGKLKALVASLEGQDIDQLIKQVPATTVAASETAKKEEAHEDKEKKEEAAVAGLSALFG